MVGVVHTAHCNWILNKKGQNQNVPSIEETQKTLVMLGDKNQKFIDSRDSKYTVYTMRSVALTLSRSYEVHAIVSLLLLLTFKTVTTENVKCFKELTMKHFDLVTIFCMALILTADGELSETGIKY
ncbi:hypothetical protein GQX74_009020 [Glossina fuscipes]|nr:hypothetical protein GQX74_009020 [Glossina fuscipes]